MNGGGGKKGKIKTLEGGVGRAQERAKNIKIIFFDVRATCRLHRKSPKE